MGDDLRKHARKSLQVDVRAKNASASGQLLFEGIDLSSGGSFLRSELLLEDGETLVVEFRVPGVPRLMKAQARIAWVRRFPKGDETAGMGIEFLAMSDEDRAVLDEYLGNV